MFEKKSADWCNPGPFHAPKSFPAPYQMKTQASTVRTATRARSAGSVATRVLEDDRQ